MPERLALRERFQFLKQAAGLLLTGTVQPNSILAMTVGLTMNPPRRRGKQLLEAYNESPWLRAAVHKVAFACASVPAQLYTRQEDGKLKKFNNPDHPLLTLLDTGIPEAALTGLNVRMLTHTNLDIIGESFYILERNVAGIPAKAWPVPPYWVTDTAVPVSKPYYTLSIPGSGPAAVPTEDVVWFKDPDPANPYLRGSGTASALADELGTDENAAKFLNRFFYNNARPPLIVSADGLSRETTNRIEEDWNRQQAGVWNAFRTHFLNRKVDVQIIEQNFQHLQFMELRRFERDLIVQVYGVPPEVLGIIENSNRATIEAADYLMAKWVVAPRLMLFDEVIQVRLIPEFDERLIYKHVDSIPANKEHSSKIALDVNAGAIMTVDERREELGKDPLPNGEGKVFLVPLNYMPVESPKDAGLDLFGGGPDVYEEEEEEEEPPAAGDGGAPPAATSPEANQERALKKDTTYDVAQVLFDLTDATTLTLSRVRPVYRLAVQDFGYQALKDLGIADPFNMSSADILRFLKKHAANKVTQIMRTTRNDLREALVEGVDAGENLAQLGQRISEVFKEAKGTRAIMIARTETGMAANFATVQAYDQSGVVEEKVWLATPDDRTRETHRDADGQHVPLDGKFQVGTEQMDYPMDPTADPGERINCRCTTTALLTEGKALHPTPEHRRTYWKQFDASLIGYARRYRIELVKAMQTLQNQTMARLNALR